MTAFEPPQLRGKAKQVLVLFGDQLDARAEALARLDPEADAVLMMEVEAESEFGPSHLQRTVMFLAAMRHFAAELVESGFRVEYVALDDAANTQCFEQEIVRCVARLGAERLLVTQPGDWRVLHEFREAAAELGISAEVVSDGHFLTTLEQFELWANGRKQLVMEYFYRDQRKRLGILVDAADSPVGGQWNFDEDNRKSFKQAPDVRRPYTPQVDEVTREVSELVGRRLGNLPGTLKLSEFRWPVTRVTAKRALTDFVKHRLPDFGTYEDAMWAGEPFLYHSLLSPALNLKLLNPRECVDAAVAAYHDGSAPLNSVEGFVRQIIGWREFIRGVYWTQSPDYRDRNGLQQIGALPEFYWSGETDMVCLSESLRPVLEHGFSHHIPRLMVLVNFALTSGVEPRAIGDWFLGMYVDSVDWVTTPNTIGMGMHADGGVVGTKPYAGSGKYIQRMSNYCKSCRYDVKARTGPDACPFNVFYWDFLQRTQEHFAGNHRMTMMIKNLSRFGSAERSAITADADRLRREFGITPTPEV